MQSGEQTTTLFLATARIAAIVSTATAGLTAIIGTTACGFAAVVRTTTAWLVAVTTEHAEERICVRRAAQQNCDA